MSHNYFKISKKSGYAVEALVELALRGSNGPVNVRNVAETRHIPLRFLEVILNELKQGGFVRSIRGKNGGYQLSGSPGKLKVGQIIVFLESGGDDENVSTGSAALGGVLSEVNGKVSDLLESVSLQDMVDRELQAGENYISNYTI